MNIQKRKDKQLKKDIMIKTNSKNSIKTNISGKSCTTNYILKSKVLGKSLRETGI